MCFTASGQAQKSKGGDMIRLMPYLLFDGRCRQAMEFYQSCLGGDLTLTKVKDSPAKDQMSAAQQDKVLNAQLRAGQWEISASDWLALDETPVRGNTVCMFLSGGSFQDLKTVFDKLSQGATVTNPLKETFFGVYGALNDKYGVRWMFQTGKQNG
jgi:PhnB protein